MDKVLFTLRVENLLHFIDAGVVKWPGVVEKSFPKPSARWVHCLYELKFIKISLINDKNTSQSVT